MQKKRSSFLIFIFLNILLFNSSVCNIDPFRDVKDLERNIFVLLNDYRSSLGLRALEWNEYLAEIARGHSKDMANKKVQFGHDGFNQRVTDISEEIPYLRVGENVGMVIDPWGNSAPDQVVFEDWLKKTGHHDTIKGPYDITGVGVFRIGAEYYFTHIFVRKK